MAGWWRWSRVGEALQPSPIRALFKLIQQPGMISFAGGLPDPAVFPVADFAAGAGALAAAGQAALQYGASEGYAPLLEWLRRSGTAVPDREVGAEELVITAGSQHALDLVGRLLLDPGDVVLVEAPTYPGALHAFRNLGARFAAVPADEEGMLVERIPEAAAAAAREAGRPPRLLYANPTFANPSGACLSTGRRRRLVEIAAGLGLPVLEDDPYGRLRYSGSDPPTLFALAGGRGAIYTSSFSKILAPGVRLAWVAAEPEVVRRLVLLRQGVDLCPGMAAQVLVADYCRRGLLEGHLPAIRAHYAAKRDRMAAALAAELPPGAAAWTVPEGGFFFWLRLPGRDGQELFRRAVAEKVAFLPGQGCFPAPAETVGPVADGASFARLCFTFATPDEIGEGARRLARALA